MDGQLISLAAGAACFENQQRSQVVKWLFTPLLRVQRGTALAAAVHSRMAADWVEVSYDLEA